jgi:hypothetical protein
VHTPQPSQETTPESYLGAEKAERFQGDAVIPGVHDYGSAEAPAPEHLRYGGSWRVTQQSATALGRSTLSLDFRARTVFLVTGSATGSRSVRVLLDGRPITAARAGGDVHGAAASVSFNRLYRLVELPRVERHVLTLAPSPGTTVYSFTFG